MKKILCPTDFSDAAHNAIAYAAKFAQKANDELVLFHVESLFDLAPSELLKGQSQSIARTKSILEAQALEVSKEFKISCWGEVQVSGVALSSIISARGKEFDLIIMGSNGPDDFYEFFTGSNTYNVIRKSSVPVLLIPEAVRYSEIKSVVLAFDYWREGMVPITQLIPWLKTLKCETLILQILEESYSRKVELELKGLQDLIRDTVPDDVTVKFDSIYADDLQGSIHNYMKRNEVDALALSTHHYSFIERLFHKSLTKGISAIAEYPVFVFHY